LINEYKCPYCGHVNIRMGNRWFIVCDKCGKSFTPAQIKAGEGGLRIWK